jgi:hypothetical protein
MSNMTDVEARHARVSEASRIMLGFAERTDIATGSAPKRYLWTDAFAVANFLGLVRATGDDQFMKLAQRLVAEVHRVLGRYRADDSRHGWISGLNEEEAECHPTRGGLRIGKPLPERRESERFDEQMEWDRDGQYFHYLTQWMHALDLVTRTTRDPTFNRWGRELGETAYAAFVYGSATHGGRRMFWKMSTDLSRPLVPSMGHHDPIDGFTTYSELRATRLTFDASDREPNLIRLIADFRRMIRPSELSTPDPLAIGGLLLDAYRLARLTAMGRTTDASLVDSLLGAALEGLFTHAARHDYDASPSERMAFRELGLAIGLRAVELIEAEVDAAPRQFAASTSIRSRLEGLARYVPLSGTTLSFWRRSEHRSHTAWHEHLDINEVMLATCLSPDGYLMDAGDEARLETRSGA